MTELMGYPSADGPSRDESSLSSVYLSGQCLGVDFATHILLLIKPSDPGESDVVAWAESRDASEAIDLVLVDAGWDLIICPKSAT